MEKIRAFLQEIFKENEIAGMSVSITDEKETLGVFNFGVESVLTGNPIGNDSRFRIASITKIVTGLTVIRLVEQGKLDLEREIGRYIEWLPKEVAKLTLNSLLSHTAGLPREYTPNGPRDEQLLESSLQQELSQVSMEQVGNNRPYLYSNLGIRLVSLIVEKVTGARFSVASKRLVLQPLGMDQTFYSLKQAVTLPLSLPHEMKDGALLPVEMWENAVRLGAGGLFSTSSDLCKLARFILRFGKNDCGEQIIQQEVIKKMLIPKTAIGAGDYYGLTMRLHAYRERLLAGHMGSAPPYCANLAIDSVSGYGVSLLINTAGKENLRDVITDSVLRLLSEN